MPSVTLREPFVLPAATRACLAEEVAALRSSSAYPRPARSVEAIETHMSWVFLTEDHAFKLKKPIQTPVLDYSSVDARRAACRQELRLNRRLAADVYLDVVPLVRSRTGALRVEGAGETVDWLVKMRRLPRQRMLDACIARGAVEAQAIDRLADRLAAFYACSESAAMDEASYRGKLLSDIDDKRRSLRRPRYGLARAAIDELTDTQLRWVDKHAELLAARAKHVVDAHGDLRLEHVCLEAEPVIIDSLEFDRSLRLLDPLSELCFFALETERAGAAWIGERVLRRYTRSEAPAPEPLLRFYRSYHALVRAAVAIWHLDDCSFERAELFRRRAEDYLARARLPS